MSDYSRSKHYGHGVPTTPVLPKSFQTIDMPLAAKLGSLLVHIDEATEPGGHQLDITAARSLLADPQVREWLESVRAMGMLPVKRSERPRAMRSNLGPGET